MRYQGSKNRLAPGILAKINPDPKRPWVEPFVGGCGMMRHVKSDYRMGIDINSYMIEFWKAIQTGWNPPSSLTKEEYENIRQRPHEYYKMLVGFAGSACSFSGKWFGGYAQGGFNTNGEPRNHAAESVRGLEKYRKNLDGVIFVNADYRSQAYPDNSIIYCDPPYEDTADYNGEQFNHKEFWDWAIHMHTLGHEMYISEYKAPRGFRAIHAYAKTDTVNQHGSGGTKFDYLYVPTGAAYGK